MSQADRLARQQEQARQQAEEMLRERTALAPKRMAVIIAATFGYFPQVWRLQGYSTIAYEGAAGIQRHTYPSTRSST